MPAPEVLLDLYLNLAQASEQQGRPLQRDKFLVLTASIAQSAGFSRIAEDCRARVLRGNPNHILKNYSTMREALDSEDILHYAQQLTRIYPFEKAEYLLYKFRASGYSGNHGYRELGSAPPTSAIKPASAARPKARRPSTPATSSRQVAQGSASPGPRPTLQRALESTSSGARRSSEPPVPPMPFGVTDPAVHHPTRFASIVCWAVFAIAIGIAAAAVILTALFPGA